MICLNSFSTMECICFIQVFELVCLDYKCQTFSICKFFLWLILLFKNRAAKVGFVCVCVCVCFLNCYRFMDQSLVLLPKQLTYESIVQHPLDEDNYRF